MRAGVVALIAVGVLAACSAGGGTKVSAVSNTSSSRSTTSTSTSTTSTTTTTTTTATSVVSTTERQTPTTEATTTTVDPCRNSTDPACGPFHWDPAVVNQPLVITLSADKTEVASGDSVTLTATESDADAPPHADCTLWEYFPEDRPDYKTFISSTSTGGGPCYWSGWPPCEQPPVRYGPWDPPAPDGGVGTTTNVVPNNPNGLKGRFGFIAFTYSATPYCGHDQPNLLDDGLYANEADSQPIFITFD